MKIQNKKLLQMMKFSNIFINLEELIGYKAHTGLISLSVCPFVRPSGIQKTYIFFIGIKIKKSSACHPFPPNPYSYVVVL